MLFVIRSKCCPIEDGIGGDLDSGSPEENIDSDIMMALKISVS
ncbi:hypothetical protein [Kineothrix sp. MB12-C1]|nr:hypothetical protein [Kineothrix sp. MB12-C1]WMC92714.1 hypothetical protein RBB56_18175 [Kineothrix sp. MB12-C1]